ncbi:hypothetical protein BST61_g1488 [Cercospora zeina]
MFQCISFDDKANIESIAAYGFTPKDKSSWDDVSMISIHTFEDAECTNKSGILFSSFVFTDDEPYPFFACQITGKVKSLVSVAMVKNELCGKAFKEDL